MSRGETCPCCGRPFEALTIVGAGATVRAPIVDGRPVDRPEILPGVGNILFPPSWTHDERRIWREMMDIPGVEWPEVRHAP